MYWLVRWLWFSFMVWFGRKASAALQYVHQAAGWPAPLRQRHCHLRLGWRCPDESHTLPNRASRRAAGRAVLAGAPVRSRRLGSILDQ
jgi:hypothetical protein